MQLKFTPSPPPVLSLTLEDILHEATRTTVWRQSVEYAIRCGLGFRAAGERGRDATVERTEPMPR